MDHLDGVLILDRTSRDQRKAAMRALRERERDAAGLRPVYLGTSAFAASVLERLARRDAPARSSSSRGRTPEGRGRRLPPPPVADAARALGLELDQPESVNATTRERWPPPAGRRSSSAPSAR